MKNGHNTNFAAARFLVLRNWWHNARSSFWFVPTVIVAGAVFLAAALVAVEVNTDPLVLERWHWLFGAGAAGSRGLLSAVAGSMITVAGVVFSITIVALSLTSSQYTPRVLRNFMRDTINQTVLGIFVGIFAYCLVVLRSIRGGDEGAFVPSFAVFVALGLAFLGIALLIFFIHHISMSIQASAIIASAADETVAAVERLFPEEIGEDADENFDGDSLPSADNNWCAIPSMSMGYVESVNGEALLQYAAKIGTIIRMERGIGEFVVQGAPLVSVKSSCPDEGAIAELNKIYLISRHRTVQQDAGFGIRQIVDIALKALSPGVNDTTTAVTCVDYLTAILVRLGPRQIASSRRFHEGELRLYARGPSFESLLKEAFEQIRQSAGGNVAVLRRQIWSLTTIAGSVSHPARLEALREQADRLILVIERTMQPLDTEQLEREILKLRNQLAPT